MRSVLSVYGITHFSYFIYFTLLLPFLLDFVTAFENILSLSAAFPIFFRRTKGLRSRVFVWLA